jgi:glycosyltransferase involved in cell wall biosynthesis
MRIAYLVNQYPKLSHTFIRREIAALEAQGVDVLRIAVRGHETGALDASDAAEAVKTKYILKSSPLELLAASAGAFLRSPARFGRTLVGALKLGRRSDGGVFKHLAYFVEACVLRRWLAQGGVTHVHAHFGTNAATVAMFSKQLGGATYSFTVHGPEEFDRPQRIALGEKVQGAEFVAAISSFCRSQIYRWSQFSDWAKVSVVRCALDPAYFDRSGPAITSKPRLLCVGRLSEEKGQMLVVRAARLLVERGVEFQVTLAGDGPLRGQIEREIRSHGLEEVVQITGWVDNQRVRTLLMESRALVVASFAEGLPVVIMEAFAMNRPVISTSIAGIPELVQSGVSGWLVAAGDVEALADAMQEALGADPAHLTAMGEKGLERTFERHRTDVEAGKLKSLFAATAGQAGGTD